MEKENYVVVLNESNTKLNEIFSNYDIKNIVKSNIDYTIPRTFYNKNINKYVIKGNIMLLDKNIRLIHQRTVKVFNKIATDLLERW